MRTRQTHAAANTILEIFTTHLLERRLCSETAIAGWRTETPSGINRSGSLGFLSAAISRLKVAQADDS
jgi:hypothetical protein